MIKEIPEDEVWSSLFSKMPGRLPILFILDRIFYDG
jgi:hypothetical protein